MAIDAFPLIEVSGTSYEMGRQHGEQAAEIVSRYLILIKRVSRTSRETLRRNAMRFLPRLKALSPQFVEEARGLADGARISFEEAMLCQVRGEAAHAWEAGCTAFALRGEATLDGNLLVPLLFSEVVNLHPVAIIVAVVFFGSLWGVWGVFFAIPLATLIQAILKAWPSEDLIAE